VVELVLRFADASTSTSIVARRDRTADASLHVHGFVGVNSACEREAVTTVDLDLVARFA